MCIRTTCKICKKPSWAGCGRHVEAALAGVKAEDRCRCQEETAARRARVVKIGNGLFAGPQLEPEDVALIQSLGIKTVLNLRNPSEAGFKSLAADFEAAGIKHVQVPWTLDAIKKSAAEADDRTGLGAAGQLERETDHLLSAIDAAELPAIVVCRSAQRASVVASAHAQSRGSDDPSKILETVRSLGVEDSAVSALSKYVNRKKERQSARMGCVRCSDQLFISSQPTEADLKEAAEKNGVRTVINLRNPLVELGSLGLGVLAREPELVKGLGMEYINYVTEMGAAPSDAELDDIAALVDRAEKPVLVHCRMGNRSKKVARRLGCTKMAE